MKSVITVIMAGMVGLYGLIIGILLTANSTSPFHELALSFLSLRLRFYRPFSLSSLLLLIPVHPKNFSDFKGFAFLASGLSVGLASLAAGMCIGIVGDAGVRANAQQEKLFVGMILMLVFAEALGLYGLIVALILAVASG